jgi:hypothetical protein
MINHNKDFYKNLPGCVCAMLDRLERKYGEAPWFGSAWDDYRDLVIESEGNNTYTKMPGYVFDEYTEGENND